MRYGHTRPLIEAQTTRITAHRPVETHRKRSRVLTYPVVVTSVVASAGLWALATLGALWVVVPVVMYHLRRSTIRIEIVGGAASALPIGRDRSYERAFREFTAIGFAPAGSTLETTWFVTPMDWRKRFPRARWLQSDDGRTFVACYRLHVLERLRLSIHSLNDRGGLMLTVSPGAKIDTRPDGDDLRVEVPRSDAATLVARHHAEVAAFCSARSLSVVPTTLAQMTEADAAFDRRFSRKVAGWGSSIIPLAFLLVPVLGASLAAGPRGGNPALVILEGVCYFAVMRVVALPFGLIVLGLNQFFDRIFGRDR